MEIQQHDGVVVDVAGSRQGFAELLREGEVLQGRREAPKAVGCCPPSPLYIGPLGGRRPREMGSPRGGGRRLKGGRGALPPKARGKLPPRVPNPRRMGGGPRGAPQPTKGWFPSTFSPRGPPGQVAPPGGPPGPFRWSRYNTDNPETCPDGRNRTSHI